MTGAEMVVKALEENGVTTVFGYPGAANCPIIDKFPGSKIKHILVRNEQGAAHMASGYARVTKQPGVCTATSGPGATNLITGIATAYMDSIPMVAITGQVSSALLGKDAFQEVDITGATHPFTKHNYLVSDGLDIPNIIDEAFYIASTGRPGPVLIDIPMDLLKKTYNYPEYEKKPISIRGYKPIGMGKAHEMQVKKVSDAIKASKKPVILVGGGTVISGATEELRDFVKMTGIPVVSTMTGIGAIDASSESYHGMIGSHGIKGANMLFNKADLVVILGSRLGDRSVANAGGLEKRAKIIHIDIDPAEIGKNVVPEIPVVGDIKDVVSQLNALMKDYKVTDEWKAEAEKIKADCKTPENTEDNGFVNPRHFIDCLSKKAGEKAYVSTEVGQNQIWVSNNYKFTDPRRFITSAGFGTMGYGLPAAIGASVATDDTVIAVMGDGSFQMDLPEMGTMCQWDIPVKMIILQNHRLGMVHEHQFINYKSNYQAVHLDGSPDFIKLAEAYGIPGMKISENSEIEKGLSALLESEGSFMLVVEVDPYEPTGGSLNMHYLPKEEK
ncbi:MAG: biosynthetic-type acetolactate synthase large subunit [Clostridia bacterium]|nr:biosynthetic-type acetolactate synthase large subunit [Clostridia bacterium]